MPFQLFTTSGTFTVPAGVTTIFAEAWGPSGGGGFGSVSGGGGGGGGAWASQGLGVTPGDIYTVVVGTAGAAGTSSAGGDGGGPTKLVNPSVVTVLSADFGRGGLADTSGPTPGVGGAAGTAGASTGSNTASGTAGSNGIGTAGGNGGPSGHFDGVNIGGIGGTAPSGSGTAGKAGKLIITWNEPPPPPPPFPGDSTIRQVEPIRTKDPPDSGAVMTGHGLPSLSPPPPPPPPPPQPPLRPVMVRQAEDHTHWSE